MTRARSSISVTLSTDTRQLAREASALRQDQVNDYLAGLLPVWMDEEHHESEIAITPRLCFG